MQDHEEQITDAARIEARFGAIFGYGWKRDLAEAVGVTNATLSVQLSTGKVPPYLVAHLEWLEVTPPAKWPDRWAKLRERAKAKAKKDAKEAKAA